MTSITLDKAFEELACSRPSTRPRLRLVGLDGNAFAILARASRAMREAGCSHEQVRAYQLAATSGDYNHLLAVTIDLMGGIEEGEEDDA